MRLKTLDISSQCLVITGLWNPIAPHSGEIYKFRLHRSSWNVFPERFAKKNCAKCFQKKLAIGSPAL